MAQENYWLPGFKEVGLSPAQKAWVTRRQRMVPPDAKAMHVARLAGTMAGSIRNAERREAKKAANGRARAAVTVTLAQLMAKLKRQDYRCAVSGLPFWQDDADRVGPTCPSLDRIKPDGDYSNANVRIVLLGVNALRGRGTDADMLRIAAAITRNFK
jgi:hypothetical protein